MTHAAAVGKAVIAQYLQGASRDRIAAENNVSAGIVSNIIYEWKKGVQESDYESVRELTVHCKKEGVNLGDLTSALRIKNYISKLGSNIEEQQVESFIVSLANSSDPPKLIEAAAQLSESGISLEKLDEHVKMLRAEKETLLRELKEARAVIDTKNEYHKKYYQNHKAHIARRYKKWAKKNPDKVKAARRNSYLKRHEYYKKENVDYYWRNRERISEKRKRQRLLRN